MKASKTNAAFVGLCILSLATAGFVQESTSSVDSLPNWLQLAIGPASGIVVLLIGWYYLAKYVRYKDEKMDQLMNRYFDHLEKHNKDTNQ